jgi:hypothetical protein
MLIRGSTRWRRRFQQILLPRPITPGAAAALGGHQAKPDRTCRHSRRRAGNLLELVNAIEAARLGCRLPVGTR